MFPRSAGFLITLAASHLATAALAQGASAEPVGTPGRPPLPAPVVDGPGASSAPPRLEIEASGEYLQPLGDGRPGVSLARQARGATPVSVGVAVRFWGWLVAGGRLGLGPAWRPERASFAEDPCAYSYDQGDGRCDVTLVYTGLFVGAHPVRHRWVDPWIRLGVGMERLRTETERSLVRSDSRDASAASAAEVTFDDAGWRWLDLRAGVDAVIVDRWRLGAFMSFSLATTTQTTQDCSERRVCTSAEYDDPVTHGWIGVGVRGVALLPTWR